MNTTAHKKPRHAETLKVLAEDSNFAANTNRWHTPIGYVTVESIPRLLREYLADAEAKRLRIEADLRVALETIDDIAPRPWSADLDDPHDEQDNGEYDDEEWVITDANEREIDRDPAGTNWQDGSTNGANAREWVALVNALGKGVP